MSESNVLTEAKASLLANAIALGLLGYGMTTVLLSLANVGLYPVGGMVLSMAIFFGGIAQVIVAVPLFGKGDSGEVGAYLPVWAVGTLGLVVASAVAPRVLTITWSSRSSSSGPWGLARSPGVQHSDCLAATRVFSPVRWRSTWHSPS